MAVIVQKFGGTSVATAEKILKAAGRAVAAQDRGNQVVVVVSARGHKTDELIDLAKEITESPPAREMDMLLATGEQESVALMAMAVQKLGRPAISLTGGQIGIETDSTHTKARIRRISTERLRKSLGAGSIVIAAGFQGVDDDLNITTLGRGGSDTTAVALAAVLQADYCEIFTDVEGVFTTDPRICPEARKLGRISYEEMLELASLGAGVMHSRSIEFAKKFRVPVYVKPSGTTGDGTLIAPESEEDRVVTGVALVRQEARVTLASIPDRPGVVSLIFNKMSVRRIPIDMIVQDAAENGLADVSFTVPQDDLADALTAAAEAISDLGHGEVRQGTNVAKVSVVGNGMRTHTGVAAQLFQSLAAAEINIGLITTSEIKISVLVDREKATAAVNTAHLAFSLHESSSMVPAIGMVNRKGDQGRGHSEELERDVVSKLASMEDIVVSEIQLDTTQCRITLRNLPDIPGTSSEIFGQVAEGGVMVDLIVQNAGFGGQANLSFTVPRVDAERCISLLQPTIVQWPGTRLAHDPEIAKLTVAGIGLRSHTGVGAKMFRALADSGVNVQLISTSEIRISTVVAMRDGVRALECLQKEFGLTGTRAQ